MFEMFDFNNDGNIDIAERFIEMGIIFDTLDEIEKIELADKLGVDVDELEELVQKAEESGVDIEDLEDLDEMDLELKSVDASYKGSSNLFVRYEEDFINEEILNNGYDKEAQVKDNFCIFFMYLLLIAGISCVVFALKIGGLVSILLYLLAIVIIYFGANKASENLSPALKREMEIYEKRKEIRKKAKKQRINYYYK